MTSRKIFVYGFLLLLVLSVSAWLRYAEPNPKLPETPPKDRRWESQFPDIALLGDSLFQWGDWEQLLPKHLVMNAGVAGQTIAQIGERADYVARSRPSQVLLLMGTNNVNRHDSLELMQREYAKVLDHTQALGMHVFVALIPNTSNRFADHIAFNRSVQSFNVWLLTQCRQRNVTCIALEPADADVTPLRADDGLHISADGYKQWAEQIEQQILSMHRAPAFSR